MTIRFRVADIDADRANLIRLFQRNLTPAYDARKFDWLYRRNPHGKAVGWVAYEEGSGKIVGASAGFPRRLHGYGREELGLILGDLCMEEEYRSMGPALQLQKATMAAVNEQPFVFCYDFPSRSMMAIYKRLGFEKTGELQRWAKPLRLERHIERVVKSKALSRVFARIPNFFLGRRGHKRQRREYEVAIQEGRCGEEFTLFDRRFHAFPVLRTKRTHDFLNWRYLDHPSAQHQMLVARQQDALVGYAVLTTGPENPAIVDLSALDQPAAATLISAASEHLRKQGAETVSLYANQDHCWSTVFEGAGFRPRESAPMVSYASPSSRMAESRSNEKWWVMAGERES